MSKKPSTVAGAHIWKDTGKWTFTHYDPDIDPALLPHFSKLIEIWQLKRQGRRVPAWQDFDFYDFKGWHGYISVYEVTYDPFDWTLRLSGSQVDELFGRPLKGMTRKERDEIAVDYEDAPAFCEQTCNELLLAHTKGPLNIKGQDFKRVEFLELPCSDGASRATHTIEALVRLA